jgi:hypothetical protein
MNPRAKYIAERDKCRAEIMALDRMSPEDKLKTYMRIMLKGESTPLSDHALGTHNGMEIALALMENRPVFYIDKNKQYNQQDIDMHPDYFL